MLKNKRGAGRPRINPQVRFWSKVNKTSDCWIWTAYLNVQGYGKFWDGEKKMLAHRFAWESLVAPIPEAMQLDHICHNPACVNPDHLRVVNSSQNNQNRKGAQLRNSTGIRGVYWDKSSRRYVATVGVNRTRHYIGKFKTLDEAARRVKEARLELHTHNSLDRIT